MPRLMLSGEFSKLKKILRQEAIYNKRNLRMTVEGERHQMRAGCLWRDLPVCLLPEFYPQKIQCVATQ